MKHDVSTAQIDEFICFHPGEESAVADRGPCQDPHTPGGKQLAKWSTLQSAKDVLRVSSEFYFPKAPAL